MLITGKYEGKAVQLTKSFNTRKNLGHFSPDPHGNVCSLLRMTTSFILLLKLKETFGREKTFSNVSGHGHSSSVGFKLQRTV